MSGLLNCEPRSLTLTLLLVSEAQQHKYQTEFTDHPAYEVIERAMSDYTDEAKADLYALMAESVDPRAPLAVIQRAVSECLVKNKERYPHG